MPQFWAKTSWNSHGHNQSSHVEFNPNSFCVYNSCPGPTNIMPFSCFGFAASYIGCAVNFCFCHKLFVLLWAIWFYCEFFRFCCHEFVIAVSVLVLLWRIWFPCDTFGFAVRYLLLPWQLWATITSWFLDRKNRFIIILLRNGKILPCGSWIKVLCEQTRELNKWIKYFFGLYLMFSS